MCFPLLLAPYNLAKVTILSVAFLIFVGATSLATYRFISPVLVHSPGARPQTLSFSSPSYSGSVDPNGPPQPLTHFDEVLTQQKSHQKNATSGFPSIDCHFSPL